MRKLVMLNRVSIDGFFASTNEATDGMDWFVWDPEVDEFTHSLIKADAMVIGETTYELFKRSWMPLLHDPNAPKEMKEIAEEMTRMTKIVFSETMTESDWDNTRFVKGDAAAVVKQLKGEEGGDIMIMGSGTLVQPLTTAKLIDEYVFIVSPVIAGEGKPLFKEVKQLSVKLLGNKSFDSGNVVLHYAVTK